MGDRATEVALFRYALVREAADAGVSKAERGRLVRALAARDHIGPDGTVMRVSRATLDRWIRALRAGGFDALKPPDRRIEPRTPAGLLALAEGLRREDPARTAAHIAEMIRVSHEWSPHPRTLQRHFARVGVTRQRLSERAVVFGRFEATERNELWVGDALHGPAVAGRKAILFAFLDDHARLATGYRWVHSEDTVRAEAALRSGLESRGVPSAVYLDNGSPFVSSQLLRACAVLHIRMIHSRPGRPEGRGKIERFFRTVRDQFLVEVAHTDVADLDRLNTLFAAWVETIYHHRVHTETGHTPLARFSTSGPPVLPTPTVLHEAFLWSETRQVTKTATVNLFSNLYEVDAALVGRRVELVFDPFDLTNIEVRYQHRPMGRAVAVRVGRHSHPQARPENPPAPPTGIDYLALVEARHREQLQRRTTSFATLHDDHAHTIDEETQ